MALITASASGKKGHEELQLIMKTVQAAFTQATTLLIPNIKGKADSTQQTVDSLTLNDLVGVLQAFGQLIDRPAHL